MLLIDTFVGAESSRRVPSEKVNKYRWDMYVIKYVAQEKCTILSQWGFREKRVLGFGPVLPWV
jgi:hypothetical protein